VTDRVVRVMRMEENFILSVILREAWGWGCEEMEMYIRLHRMFWRQVVRRWGSVAGRW